MAKNKIIENIDLIMEEPKKPIEKAKFIISHVYYFVRTFYKVKLLNSFSNDFEKYLNAFKNKFKPKIILNKFSFELLNRSYRDESPNIDSNTNIDDSNEKNFYDLLYKKLINIINEKKFKKDEKNIIKSFISLRNCLIFLEYLYLFINKYPDKISHYIIKIDISLLLDIPQKVSKRLINSNEFFYLNLIELKSIFSEIDFAPSKYISRIENLLFDKYIIEVIQLKMQKLNTLEEQLTNLLNSLSKIIDKNLNNKISLLYDDLNNKYENLIKDINDVKVNLNYDEIIKKYILEPKSNKNKYLKTILNEINEKEITIPSFNYLFLIALNNFDKLNLEEHENEVDENQKPNNETNKNEKNNVDNTNNIEEKEKSQSENIITIQNCNIVKQIKDKNEKEKIIKIEELRINNKKVIEKDILGLEPEKISDKKISKNIYFNYINNNFLYDKVLNLKKDNIYNILLFLEINKKRNEKNIENMDNIYIDYKNNFISLMKNLNYIDYNYFYDLISDNEFYDDIISILKSKPIFDYLNENRYYEDIKNIKKTQKYDFKFVQKGEPFTENLSNEYKIFMSYLENNIFFINLFRLKFLPFGIKAFVNYNLKIFINSLYYELSKNINETNKKIILKAALKIIIIHEIIHILKYLKINASFNQMPNTPREREGGEMLINYLFGKPVIKRINLEEAKKINNLDFWKNVDNLRKIFQKDTELLENDESNYKNIDYIDLYLIEEDIDDENMSESLSDEDIGIDID